MKKDFIKINKKSIRWIAPAVVIIALILSKREPSHLLLFLIGIVIGFFIHKDLN